MRLAGPSYELVAEKYADEEEKAAARLAEKVLKGAAGGVTDVAAPAAYTRANALDGGLDFVAERQHSQYAASRFDRHVRCAGAAEDSRERGRACVHRRLHRCGRRRDAAVARRENNRFHSRRKAALYDANYGMQYVEQVEGEKGIIGHFQNGDVILFRELNLAEVSKISARRRH